MRGSIVQRKSKQGKILYYVVVPYGGRQKWLKVPGDQTKKNAEAYRAQVVTEANQGALFELPKITFAEFAAKWQATAAPDLAPNTVKGYEVYLKNYILPAFGGRQLAHITQEEIQRWKVQLLDRLAPVTVKTTLARLKHLFRVAVDWQYLIKNPATGVPAPRVPKTDVVFLRPEQIRTLLDATTNHQWRTFFLVAVTGGLRIGELVAMKWQSLDWDTGRYLVCEAYQYMGQPKGFKAPKSDYSVGSVQLSPICMDHLKKHKGQLAEYQLKTADYQDLDLIFPRRKGTVHDPRGIQARIWTPLLGRAALPSMRLHDLRHTCAALLIDQGESPKYVQQQLRHSSIKITFDTYGHLFPEKGQEAAERLDKTLFG